MTSSLSLALLAAGVVLAWRRAVSRPPLPHPPAFATLLVVAGVLAPDVAALALNPAGRPLVVSSLLGLFLAAGLAACVRPCAAT